MIFIDWLVMSTLDVGDGTGYEFLGHVVSSCSKCQRLKKAILKSCFNNILDLK